MGWERVEWGGVGKGRVGWSGVGKGRVGWSGVGKKRYPSWGGEKGVLEGEGVA